MDFVGIDVGSKELVVVMRHQGKNSKPETVANMAACAEPAEVKGITF